MTMSQTLTKPAWPEATTRVTTAGWKYHSTIPLPPLYFGMTKRQCSGRAQNHKTSVASHIMALHLLSPPSHSPRLHSSTPVSVKSPWSNALTQIYTVSLCLGDVSIPPPPLLLCSASLSPFLCLHASLPHCGSAGEHMHFLCKMQLYSDFSAVWKWHLAGKHSHAASTPVHSWFSSWLIYSVSQIFHDRWSHCTASASSLSLLQPKTFISFVKLDSVIIFNCMHVHKMLRLMKNSSDEKNIFRALIQNNVIDCCVSEDFICTETSIENSYYICYCHIGF